jgi:thiamine kinase-like enzyme
MTLENICSEFSLDKQNVVSIQLFGSGHIHDTYRVATNGNVDYILQKINSSIFKNVPLMQANMVKVINHLKKNNTGDGQMLEMLRTPGGLSYFTDEDGAFWRMFVFLPGTKTHDRVSSPEIAFEAGKAFGNFQLQLNDFDPSALAETLPRFHDIYYRLELFEKAVANDPVKRVQELSDEIEFVRSRAERMKLIFDLGQKGEIPVRVTHNDTKINNVLFNEQGKAVCVIDLDTVMPGYIHYDFGDAIRTGAASADEDEKDVAKMFIDLRLFEAYTRGFLDQVHSMLNKTEKETLAFAPQLMTFIIGLRFLTDYINGDVYFKIKSQDHNLIRWKAQKKLLLSMEKHEEEMDAIIKNIENKGSEPGKS